MGSRRESVEGVPDRPRRSVRPKESHSECALREGGNEHGALVECLAALAAENFMNNPG